MLGLLVARAPMVNTCYKTNAELVEHCRDGGQQPTPLSRRRPQALSGLKQMAHPNRLQLQALW